MMCVESLLVFLAASKIPLVTFLSILLGFVLRVQTGAVFQQVLIEVGRFSR
ncbi:hypothetical protein RRSWK_07202 [Rhodopirellula sp. SWK7]|nr:hypothetical protein RRSWK_07202 [Rhodopirellula sp. SWK7]